MNSLETELWRLIVMGGFVLALVGVVYAAHLVCKGLDAITNSLRYRSRR